jgi:hypothetical protein
MAAEFEAVLHVSFERNSVHYLDNKVKVVSNHGIDDAMLKRFALDKCWEKNLKWLENFSNNHHPKNVRVEATIYVESNEKSGKLFVRKFEVPLPDGRKVACILYNHDEYNNAPLEESAKSTCNEVIVIFNKSGVHHRIDNPAVVVYVESVMFAEYWYREGELRNPGSFCIVKHTYDANGAHTIQASTYQPVGDENPLNITHLFINMETNEFKCLRIIKSYPSQPCVFDFTEIGGEYLVSVAMKLAVRGGSSVKAALRRE